MKLSQIAFDAIMSVVDECQQLRWGDFLAVLAMVVIALPLAICLFIPTIIADGCIWLCRGIYQACTLYGRVK